MNRMDRTCQSQEDEYLETRVLDECQEYLQKKKERIDQGRKEKNQENGGSVGLVGKRFYY